ncbi:cation:proton antiporter [Candidatus Enterococcus leclercqii]|uniref:cation:proton antiporter n=1 Tax=Candidatus Enterococcus leclercqii TaxID=1857218 RepID=UPI001379729B|nr:sodium:proton antiporter [Enterococcus sp. CU9D]KAF1292832.1 sodium:proton antiporter [Enterococcus sp. CU9D]
MELVELVIVITVAITFSNVLAKILPNIPIFFVQIFLGILVGLSQWGRSLNFQPEIFLVLIIAPLLFREGEHADLATIFKNFGTILSLAFGGVILTLLAVGGLLNVLMPTIPLAACMAFGAALGPTDAVAVSSIAKPLKMPPRVMRILEGEGLLNDASGVTAFQFAVAALITGSFSIWQASWQLLAASLGGVLVGGLVVWLKRRVIRVIEQAQAQEVTSYLLIELLLPFVAYVFSELVGVSGIIAAVTAGVMQAGGRQKVTLFQAELANVSQAVWNTVVFTLNGLVFIFLGIEISQVFSPIWESDIYANERLLLVILLVTVLLFVIRLLFLLLLNVFLVKDGQRKSKQEILLLTFGGVKGTVSLATIFILPTALHGAAFHQRSVLLFLTAGVILLSLVISLVVMPLIADGEAEAPVDEKGIAVLEEVLKELQQDEAAGNLTENETIALKAVRQSYASRIWETYTEAMTDSERQEVQEIQALILSIERDGLDESFRRQLIDVNSYRFYSRFIANFQHSFGRQILSFLSFWLLVVRRILRVILHPKLFWQRRHEDQQGPAPVDLEQLQTVYRRNTQLIQQSLASLEGVYDEKIITYFLQQRKTMMGSLKRNDFMAAVMIRQDPAFTKEVLRGYYLERKVIDEFESREEITTFSANEYRRKVNLLESYAMSQIGSTPNFSMKRFIRK